MYVHRRRLLRCGKWWLLKTLSCTTLSFSSITRCTLKKVLKVLTTNTQKCSPSLLWIRNKKAVSSMNAVSQSVSEQSVALNSWIRLQHSEPCITGKATPRRDKFRSKTFSTTLYDCWFDYERMKRRDSPVRVALMWSLISEWWISAAISD